MSPYTARGGLAFWVSVLLLSSFLGPNGFAQGLATQDDYLRAVLGEPSLVAISNLEVPSVANLRLGNDHGVPHLELRVYGGQPRINDRIRSEVSVDFPFQEGETVRYQWQFRIPASFPSDAPRNRWWIITQWHDQPDPSRGETWQTFPSRSPPLLIGYGNLDGKDAIALSAGPQQRSVGVVFFEREVWHTVRLDVTWSTTEGEALLYWEESPTPALSYRGPTMNNGYQHYLKFGQYRHPGITTDNTIAFRAVWIEKLARTR